MLARRVTINDIMETNIPRRFRLDMTCSIHVNSCILSHTDAHLDVLTLQVLVGIYATSTHWNDNFYWTSITDPNTDERRPTDTEVSTSRCIVNSRFSKWWSILLKFIVWLSCLRKVRVLVMHFSKCFFYLPFWCQLIHRPTTFYRNRYAMSSKINLTFVVWNE